MISDRPERRRWGHGWKESGDLAGGHPLHEGLVPDERAGVERAAREKLAEIGEVHWSGGFTRVVVVPIALFHGEYDTKCINVCEGRCWHLAGPHREAC